MTPDSVALRVAQSAARHHAYAFDDVTACIEGLAALGYEFVPAGSPGGRIHESDEYKSSMAKFLTRTTGVPWQIARGVIAAIEQHGLRIREPDQHPSGLRTTEPAFTNVQPFGARRAAAQKPTDDRAPGEGRNYA